ncbi:DUF4224 domain-containing protein [Chitinophaga barathri]|uniref:DUF4224 domain-containing protein n=1 Tax=Chitinophaga barathri TaxID=1647451 RepID=A0A3N4MA30_9BACT|nr:DUF4224 domain-containing protein [Chitinophaga barathri]RPD40614.1 DUF4224 domain-containing protein [Chitinophaga barathri]
MPILSDDEIIRLTKRKQKSAQQKILRFMGIEHRTRPDGSVIVSRSHIEKTLDGDSVNNRIIRRTEPDWSIFNAKTSPK